MNLEKPMNDNDLDALQASLDLLDTPLEPLDVSALDGFLVGVLLQPTAIAQAFWWPLVIDPEQAAPPAALASPQALATQALVLRRYEHLNRAIRSRDWFDPWVFELDTADAAVSDSVLPWVAGFALAMDLFPALMDDCDSRQTLEPLALIYTHFDADDLEDADALLEAIAELEPATTLMEAVEDLVSAVMLLADVTRPPPPSQAVATNPSGKPRRTAPPSRSQRSRR